MKSHYWIRVGAMGYVGSFAADDACDYPRATRVLCQTRRGLEVGEILSPAAEPDCEADGRLIRLITDADQPHLSRLEMKAKSAYGSCRHWLQQRGMSTILMDVENLFDGRTLYFYFMGGPPSNSMPLLTQLRRTYQVEIQFRHYGKAESTIAEASCCSGNGGCCESSSSDGELAVAGGCKRGSCSDCEVSAYCGKRQA